MSAIDTVDNLGDTLTLLGNLPARPPLTDPALAVTLTVSNGADILLHPPDERVVEAANQLLRSRQDWLDVPGTAPQVHAMTLGVLKSLGLDPEVAAELPGGLMQLTFTDKYPATAAAFPWEFALAEATRPRRRRLGESLLVFRHFANGHTPLPAPASLLVVVNAPNGIADRYSFDSERNLVASTLELTTRSQVVGASLDEITEHVRTQHPDVVHVAGVDARQGQDLLGSTLTNPGNHADGIVVSDATYNPTVASYADFAKALAAGGGAQLVGFNLYNSALGAMEAVRAGAIAAIGFHDEIDDAVAEQFFARFYSGWKRSDWDLLDAFKSVWHAMAPEAERLRGTGIVLWSGVPLVSSRGPIRRGTGDGRVTSRALGTPGGTGAAAQPAAGSTGTGGAPATEWAEATEAVLVTYRHPESLNYALLHNNETFIPELVLKKQQPGTYRLSVEVTISAGGQQAPYRQTFVLDDKTPVHSVHQKVRIPLTSRLLRTLDEGLQGISYARVTDTTNGERVVLEQTESLTFRPIDQWQYDDATAKWLPSFVFPRDPAVRKVIASAQRYLAALRDDSAAGFDGYQSYDDDKTLPLAERSRNIDAQVQAIWWALVSDYALGYINPPPNYVKNAQRLRTPSEVVDGGRGTCIDLALLFAACLEYVEIYPVIFMLNDHAFPGYWRSEASYEQLGRMSLKTGTGTGSGGGTGTGAGTGSGTGTGTGTGTGSGSGDGTKSVVADRDIHTDPWMTGRGRFAEITNLVHQGHLVPLETVNLTSRAGFWDSVTDGTANLRSKRQFYALYDLLTARSTNVTPLPLWSKRI